MADDDDLARGQRMLSVLCSPGMGLKLAVEAVARELGKQQPTADKKPDKPRRTDKKTDKEKKLPPHDVNDCARYFVEQQKLIKKGERPAASKKQLIAEHIGSNDTGAMERQLQPDRFGWLLDINGQADK